ncbi:MAG: Fic family protein [Microgenomates group bacterium Gr01-1014_7]|nr:MAG: Fic family protein [Microgenomates group bacterium Gr01-1014_7]
MRIPPEYSITSEMLELLARIEVERIYFSSIHIPAEIKDKIQRLSLLKSSLFSARIEGNTLELSDLDSSKAEESKQREVFNILDAASLLDKGFTKGKLIKKHLLQLHAQVLKDLHSDAGIFRKEPGAIFNQAGIAVYVAPPPSKISSLLDRLLAYTNSDEEKFPLISAFISHLIFEKIHPFLDGNGRLGRLMIAAILKAKGWDFTFIIPFEEYLDSNRNDYYLHLGKGLEQTNEYILFMLNSFYDEILKLREQVNMHLSKKDTPFLPPRQEEIYNIIKDQVVVSFDIIRRRFLSVPERTLRFDLKRLVDKRLIETSGETKGRYYRIKKKPVPLERFKLPASSSEAKRSIH